MDSPAPTAASAVSASGTGQSPSSSTAGFGGFGAAEMPGGLASSPNVPAPGSTLDPSTGLPHTAGLTRAELDARKAAAVGGAQSSGLMGGLGSSFNVPAPGSSLDPSTGQPHVAGLTRAELDAITAKGKGLLDPAPSGVEIRRESAIRSNFAAPDLSGRDQAAAQLVGTGLVAPSSPTARKGSIVDTARELGQKAYEAVPAGVKGIFAEPKGKGVEGSPVKARRGSAAALFDNVRVQAVNLATTVKEAVVYDPDINKTLPAASTTGAPASGLKDAHVAPVNATLAEPTAPAGRRASVLDAVALQAKKLGQDVQTAVSQSNAEGGVLSQVKGFVRDAFQDPGDSPDSKFASPAQRYAFGTVPVSMVRTPPTAASAAVPSPTLPSQENQGARPGEVSGGVGALPGKLSEAGVAVPPAVRETEGSAGGLIATSSAATTSTAVPSGPSGFGTTAGLAGAGVGAGAVAAALLGEPRPGGEVSGLKNHSIAPVTATVEHALSSASPSTGLPDLHATTANSNASHGLAAPLPATFLGTGAARGATDIEATHGVNASTASSTAPTDAASISASAVDSSPATSLLSPGREPNNRTESLASVTAIRHGHTGSRDHAGESSPLATLSSSMDGEATDGQKSTTRGTGPNHTSSLSPGDESQGVGHPETKGLDGTSRTPGQYPAANAAGPAVGEATHKRDESTTSSAGATSTTGGSSTTAAALPETTKSTPSSNGTPAATPTPATPAKSSAAATTGAASAISPAGRQSLEKESHKRTGSNSSNGKKVGFMQKLKGEVKILSGKMSHDEGKIAQGEKIKHGEA